jgi:hypothetical protein
MAVFYLLDTLDKLVHYCIYLMSKHLEELEIGGRDMEIT